MRVLAGTSGYAYDEWKGSFYPEDLPAKGRLAYYATRLPAVEINNTFYRMPRRDVVAGWAAQVGDGFRFVLKATMRITHKKRLKDAGDEFGYIVDTARGLGGKLGPMLFQLPPFLRKDTARLEAFLDLFPEGWRAAFEFRHASWFEDDVFEALRARDVALVVADAGDEPGDDAADSGTSPLVVTARYGYLRLRRPAYDAAALDTWAATVRGQPWEEAYVFFKHEADGPRLAHDFGVRF